MKKRGFIWFFIALILFLLPQLILASSVDEEIKKITHYAEEYETGNINYVQLLLHTSSVRQNLNELLGATEKEMGGVLKQEQIKATLGLPTEETKWVWVESEEQEKRLDKEVPAWQKIVFDGKKIQIKLNAWPSLFKKKQLKEFEENKEKSLDSEKEETESEEKLIYRLNFEIIFKKPEEQLDIEGKIKEIQVLAQNFNSDPTNENAETLARESVNAERTFESFFRQKQGKCEDIMKSLFGSENQRAMQKMFVQEISFYEGENFEVIARLEMCDECEWSWINLDLWIEGRGKFKMPKEVKTEQSPESYANLDDAGFEEEIKKLLEEFKVLVEQGEYSSALALKSKLWPLNEAWNKKSNDLWPEVDKIFEAGRSSMSEEEMQKFNENYGWLKEEQVRRAMVRELQNKNYEKRKAFYLDLFSGYEKKEYYFEQLEFEKRLIEEFREFGREICDNNQDDNTNEKIDCDDEQCGGKICGWTEVGLSEEISSSETQTDSNQNETDNSNEELNQSSFLTGNVISEETNQANLQAEEVSQKKRPMHCINKICQLKEEIIEKKEAVCGNHICEENETENCAEDCSICPAHAPINCAGKVIFKGEDENGCPLEPVCLEEEACQINEDCKFLCGEGECVEGTCKLIKLKECKEAECVDGDEKIQNCDSGEKIVAEKCIEGIWIKTGLECEIKKEGTDCKSQCEAQSRIDCNGKWEISGDYPNCNCNWVCEKEEISGDECATSDNCGNPDDVCSNGECVTLPENLDEEEAKESEETDEKKTEEAEESEKPEESTTTGEVIFTFFRTLLRSVSIAGKAITGFETEETDSTADSDEQTKTPSEEQDSKEGELQETKPESDSQESAPSQEQDNEQSREERQDDEKDRREEERKRMEEENKERCKKECVRPCIEKCTREECGESMDCSVDDTIKKCEQECTPEENCVEKCMKGGDWWQEFQEAPKQEKGVFQVGGSCRTNQGKTESFIWFGGWGDPFEKIQYLKPKYYSGGEADWCKQDLENLKKRRKAFEQSFNEEFVTWFFEKHLANSAEDWEESTSGIFDIYWSNVDTLRELAFRLDCLDEELNEEEFSLISINYSTEYGSLEFWEEIAIVKMPGLDKEVKIITPYMKIWIFPPKEFIIYEMKKSMKNHEFPGNPEDKAERKNEEGPTSEEKEMIKQDKKFMKKLRSIAEKYDGNLDAVIQLKDYEKDEIVFNLYVQVNEEDILKMKPMLPEEVPAEDIKAEIDFEKIYEMIYFSEKEMRGAYTESPPWAKKSNPVGKVKEITNGIKMYFKVRSIMNSAKVIPEESKSDVKSLFKSFFSMMQKAEQEMPKEGEMQDKSQAENVKEDVLGSKEEITGEIVRE